MWPSIFLEETVIEYLLEYIKTFVFPQLNENEANKRLHYFLVRCYSIRYSNSVHVAF